MKHKAVLFSVLMLLFALILFNVHGCKDEAVVESTPPANQDPNTPKLVSPVNEATLNNFAPVLDWEDFSGAESYRIQISLDANFAGIMVMDSSGITTSGFNTAQGLLSTNSYYYWRVNASISGGVTSWSLVWRFHIILEPPEAPALLAPPNGANNQPFTPVLDWNEPANVEFYRLQIGSTPVFNAVIFDSTRINPSQVQLRQFLLYPNRQYYWRVNASNSGGASTSPWSAVWSFTTMDGPEPNSISGTITFVDTNFLPSPYYYKVGAFENWPPVSLPLENDSLNITLVGNLYKADYKISRISSGIYFVAVYPETAIIHDVKILGIYGCDTVHVNFSTCPQNPSSVEIFQNWGIENINFLSWADTTKRIF
jgi:hypothetical protein